MVVSTRSTAPPLRQARLTGAGRHESTGLTRTPACRGHYCGFNKTVMVEASLQAARVVCSFGIRSPDIQLDLSTGTHGYQSCANLLGLNASQINAVKREPGSAQGIIWNSRWQFRRCCHGEHEGAHRRTARRFSRSEPRRPRPGVAVTMSALAVTQGGARGICGIPGQGSQIAGCGGGFKRLFNFR